jgi:glucuronosyltransferase
VCSTQAARILGIFPTPSISHQLTFQVIMKALTAREHQITVISPNTLKVFCLLSTAMLAMLAVSKVMLS